MTTDTTAATTLADRARAERVQFLEAETAAAERNAAELRGRLLREATEETGYRFGDPDLGDWHLIDTDESEPLTAETTIDGLRFRYSRRYTHGDYELVIDCDACRSGVRRAGISRHDAMRRLADLLDTIDDPKRASWYCQTCDARAAEQAALAALAALGPEPTRQAAATPAATFAEQLEQLVRAIVRDEFQEPPF